jgi:hypothetical protein
MFKKSINEMASRCSSTLTIDGEPRRCQLAVGRVDDRQYKSTEGPKAASSMEVERSRGQRRRGGEQASKTEKRSEREGIIEMKSKWREGFEKMNSVR